MHLARCTKRIEQWPMGKLHCNYKELTSLDWIAAIPPRQHTFASRVQDLN